MEFFGFKCDKEAWLNRMKQSANPGMTWGLCWLRVVHSLGFNSPHVCCRRKQSLGTQADGKSDQSLHMNPEHSKDNMLRLCQKFVCPLGDVGMYLF